MGGGFTLKGDVMEELIEVCDGCQIWLDRVDKEYFSIYDEIGEVTFSADDIGSLIKSLQKTKELLNG